jgi:hypothetical protein
VVLEEISVVAVAELDRVVDGVAGEPVAVTAGGDAVARDVLDRVADDDDLVAADHEPMATLTSSLHLAVFPSRR